MILRACLKLYQNLFYSLLKCYLEGFFGVHSIAMEEKKDKKELLRSINFF